MHGSRDFFIRNSRSDDNASFIHKVSANVSGAQSKYLKSTPKDIGTTTALSGIYGNIFYNFTDEFAIGFDFRNENFGVLRATYNDIFIEETQNFNCYGAALRFANKFSNGLTPYGQISVSGNSRGAVLGVRSGFKYSLFERLALTGGIEYQNFFYIYLNNNGNSHKIGINYGLEYNF